MHGPMYTKKKNNNNNYHSHFLYLTFIIFGFVFILFLCCVFVLFLCCVVYGIFETCFISSCHLTGFGDLQNKYVCTYVYKQSKKGIFFLFHIYSRNA